MANIRIPEKFEAKIRQGDQRFHGIILRTLAEFGEILEDNKLYFFEEYTDHGIQHIQNVMAGSENLASPETLDKILNPRDIGSYLLSVVLHDIAMHIGLEGFTRLIEGDFDEVRVADLDKYTWKELWADYLDEARKFNQKQLAVIFGEENIIIHPPSLSAKAVLSQRDKKLIGEFIRRHHARLAHEIALKGFPGGPGLLGFAGGLDDKHKSLIGLIARSHGMGLRTCIDFLEADYGKNNKRHPLGIHAVYLMVLLRISDYIQIDGRTSSTLLKLKSFASPFSEAEHRLHLSIQYVDLRYQDDPERIYVSAAPTDSTSYLKLQQLIRDIQSELDTSWAVLGEHYGSVERLEIKYRRIISNLGEERFKANQSYVPDHFSFRASDEIIRLLIAPLYGDDPSYGVRELLQNAVDACKEEEEIQRKKGLSGYEPLITVEILEDDHNDQFFIISDNGVGMSPAIIRDYFLTAGASFRKSTAWEKAFVDAGGHTTIRRNGRFGIGLLAAFLIGKDITVQTRKRGAEYGYTFSAGLHTTQINITKDASALPGTRIRVRIDPAITDQFEIFEDQTNFSRMNASDPVQWYQWYVLATPVIKYSYMGRAFTAYAFPYPDMEDTPGAGWQSIEPSGFRKIYWTYLKGLSGAPLSCNGIIIPILDNDRYNINMIDIYTNPAIVVFDYEGSLPLTLDRKSFSASPSFERELAIDIYKDFIACVLMSAGITRFREEVIEVKHPRMNYPAFMGKRSVSNLDTLLFSKKGFLINAQYCIERSGKLDVIVIQSEKFGSEVVVLDLEIEDAFLQLSGDKMSSVNEYVRGILSDSNEDYMENDDWDWDPDRNPEKDESPEEDNLLEDDQAVSISRKGNLKARIYMKQDRYKALFKAGKKTIPVWFRKDHQIQFETEEWICFQVRDPNPGPVTQSFLGRYADTINFIKEYTLEKSTNVRILNELLERYLGDDVLIPYALEERMKKYPLAFQELESYMKKYK